MKRPTSIQIAIVDDDPSVCRSLRRLLVAAGMQARTYESAEAFLSEPDRDGFDCIVLDVRMPGISGIELRERLLNEGTTAAMIFLSAQEPEASIRPAQDGSPAIWFRKTEPGSVVIDKIHQLVA